MLIALPQNMIIKSGTTSVARGYRNARNLAGLNFSSAGIMYASTVNQIYNLKPAEGLACFLLGNYNIIQGFRNLSNIKLFRSQYKQIQTRAAIINSGQKHNIIKDFMKNFVYLNSSQQS